MARPLAQRHVEPVSEWPKAEQLLWRPRHKCANDWSAPQVRATGKRSPKQRHRPAAIQGQLCLPWLPLGLGLVAAPNVDFTAVTVSRPASTDRFLTRLSGLQKL